MLEKAKKDLSRLRIGRYVNLGPEYTESLPRLLSSVQLELNLMDDVYEYCGNVGVSLAQVRSMQRSGKNFISKYKGNCPAKEFPFE